MTNTLLLVFHDMRLGGVQRKIVDIISFYQQHFPHTRIILCLREKQGIFLKQIPKNIRVISPTFYTRRFNMTWFTLWLIKQIARIHPTQIVAFMDLAAVPTLIALRFLPHLHPQVTIGEDILTSKYIFTESFPPLRRLLIHWLYPLANTILVQTPIQKKDLEQMISHSQPNPKIIASPNWLPLEFPPPHFLSTDNRPNDILYVGRIDDQKNLPLFIDIIGIVKQTIPHISAVIVGDGAKKSEIQKLIRNKRLQKNIKIVAPTLNTIPFYTQSKIFLLTSNYEGFPLTLIEAISCGCIPITRDIPEVSQFFTSDKSKIIFQDAINASQTIINSLRKPSSTHLKPYLKRILTNQKKHILAFVQHFSRP